MCIYTGYVVLQGCLRSHCGIYMYKGRRAAVAAAAAAAAATAAVEAEEEEGDGGGGGGGECFFGCNND